jgi:putative RecB family exonuclease
MMSTAPLTELRKRPHWSYSSINRFLNVCALQWAFRYVYDIPAAFTPTALVTGKTFHRVASFVSVQFKAGASVKREEALTLGADLLAQEVRTAEPAILFDPEAGDDINSLQAQLRRLLETWLDSRDPAVKVLHVDAPFAVPLEDAEGERLDRPLIGEFDCVVEADGLPVLVDWKTSARKWPESRVRIDLQPTCYLYAWSKLGGRTDTRFRFEIVTKTKTPVVERVETLRRRDDFQRLVECVKIAEGMIRRELFLPSDQSYACADCPWGMACAGWHGNRSRSLHRLELAA